MSLVIPPDTETLVCELLAGYIDSRRTELELPASSALPCRLAWSGDEATKPQILFVSADFTIDRPHRMTLQIVVEYQTRSDKTTKTVESQTSAKIRYALTDLDGLASYFQGLPLADRQGYRIHRIRATGGGTGANPEKNLRGRRTELEVSIRTDELAPPYEAP